MHYSSFYVVVNFELSNSIVQVRTSIIPGDIPLLLSRTVLGKLGMIYDIEGGTADFSKVGLRSFRLLNTPSGHPAIPIIPAKTDLSSAPTLQIEDLRLQPMAEYMTVFAVACASPKAPELTKIFPEKKLDPAVKSMLRQDRLPHDTFYDWWERTELDRDFWLETPSAWMRIHVVPRRAMFNPSTWRTGSTIMKDMLVATLGKTRMTECTCCSSRRWLESTVDQWEADRSEQPSFPLLWIGRTVLYKQQAPGPVLQRAPRGDEQPLAMQGQQGCDTLEPNAQASAAGGSDETGNDGASEVDCHRVEGSHPRTQGGHGGERPLEPHAEDQLPEPPGTSREGHPARRGLPRQGDERDPPQVDQGSRQHAGEHPDDHRTGRVPRDPAGLWSLGPGGDHAISELPPGPGALRALVAGRTGGQGGEGEDPRRGRGRELLRRDPPTDKGYAKNTKRQNENLKTEGEMESQPDPAVLEEIKALETKLAVLKESPQQRALSAKGGPLGDDKGKQKHCVCCRGSVAEDDVITEEAYVRGYVNRATNYATHNEHHDHLGEARQNPETADRYAKYGEGDFDWGDYSFENCEKFLRETHGVGTKFNLRSIHDPDPEHGGDQAYVTYGMFTHGGVTGLTKVTKEAEPIVRYLNGFAKAHLKDDAAWTSSARMSTETATTLEEALTTASPQDNKKEGIYGWRPKM